MRRLENFSWTPELMTSPTDLSSGISLKTEIAPYSRNELIGRCALAIMVDMTLSIGVFTIAFHRCLQMSIRSYVVSEHRL